MSHETPIISLSNYDKEKFKRFIENRDNERNQKYCNHNESVVFDGEIDELICEKCKKKWTSFEFMWYWIEDKVHPKTEIYQIEKPKE